MSISPIPQQVVEKTSGAVGHIGGAGSDTLATKRSEEPHGILGKLWRFAIEDAVEKGVAVRIGGIESHAGILGTFWGRVRETQILYYFVKSGLILIQQIALDCIKNSILIVYTIYSVRPEPTL